MIVMTLNMQAPSAKVQTIRFDDLLSVEFEQPLLANSAAGIASSVGVKPVQLISVVKTKSGTTFTHGYVLPKNWSAIKLNAAYQASTTAMLKDLAAVIASDIEYYVDDETRIAELLSEQSDNNLMLADLEERHLQPKITSMVIKVPSTRQVKNLQVLPNVRSVEKFEIATRSKSVNKLPAQVVAVAACKNWWPYKGYISTRESGTVPGERYSAQGFTFSQAALDNLLSCHRDSTSYEPDAYYNNNDGKIFLGKATHWSANFGGAYLDTQILDSQAEKQYTVGAGRVNLLAPEFGYRTLIRTKRGAADVDQGKAWGQRGRNDCPFGTVGPLCVLDAAESVPFVPAWEHAVPGRVDWKK
jgi:hypothetical protein